MATATDPQLVTWSADFDGSLEKARNAGKYVLLDFCAAPASTACTRLDAEAYGNPQVTSFIATHFVPVRVHVKDNDTFERLSERFGVQDAPHVVILNAEGTLRHRIEGFVPAEDFLTQLILGVGHAAFAEGQFATAEERFRDVVEQHGFTAAAPEALYWAGVARYEATGSKQALKETADAFAKKYPESTWARKASAWM